MDPKLCMFLDTMSKMKKDSDYSDILDHTVNYDDKMMNVESELNFMIIELLEEGYTEDEIIDMIDYLSPNGISSLKDYQQDTIRKYAKKLMKKRKEKLYYE